MSHIVHPPSKSITIWSSSWFRDDQRPIRRANWNWACFFYCNSFLSTCWSLNTLLLVSLLSCLCLHTPTCLSIEVGAVALAIVICNYTFSIILSLLSIIVTFRVLLLLSPCSSFINPSLEVCVCLYRLFLIYFMLECFCALYFTSLVWRCVFSFHSPLPFSITIIVLFFHQRTIASPCPPPSSFSSTSSFLSNSSSTPDFF